MQKVYRLLRNNQELGPFTLEELLQKDLKPLDLIWVEGKSAAWAYPFELEALKVHVPPPPKPASVPSPSSANQRNAAPMGDRHIFVSLPEKARRPSHRQDALSLEERAEAMRQRAQDFQPAAATPDALLQTNYTRSLDTAEEEFTRWYYDKKTGTKKRDYRSFGLVALTGAMIAGGLFAGQALLKGSTHTQQNTLPVQKTMPQATILSEPVPVPQATTADTLFNPVNTPEPATTQTTLTAGTTPKPAKAAKQPAAVQPQVEQQVVASAETTPEPKTEAEVIPVQTNTQPEAPAVAAEKKKKGLFGGLFRKKTGPETKDGTDAPAERKAARRTEVQPVTTPATSLTDLIELRSDATGDKWMLGVMGQKLTLVNHNTQPIKSAVVEVNYFGEDNTLLDRKKLNFGGVGAKQKAIAALPDHRQAERVTFQVLSAE